MNMTTSISLLLKTITFVAVISLHSAFAHELFRIVIVEPIQSFDKPGALSATFPQVPIQHLPSNTQIMNLKTIA